MNLSELPASHRNGPDYLNVLRVLDIPQAVAIAAERCQVHLIDTDPKGWEYPIAVGRRLDWSEKRLVIEPLLSTTSR